MDKTKLFFAGVLGWGVYNYLKKQPIKSCIIDNDCLPGNYCNYGVCVPDSGIPCSSTRPCPSDKPVCYYGHCEEKIPVPYEDPIFSNSFNHRYSPTGVTPSIIASGEIINMNLEGAHSYSFWTEISVRDRLFDDIYHYYSQVESATIPARSSIPVYQEVKSGITAFRAKFVYAVTRIQNMDQKHNKIVAFWTQYGG